MYIHINIYTYIQSEREKWRDLNIDVFNQIYALRGIA